MNFLKKRKIICRCEEVTEDEILEAIKDGALNLDAIKRMTRAGMGLCQGRTCSRLIEEILHRTIGIPYEEIILITPRAPLRPIPAKFLAKENSSANKKLKVE
ncbi:MAG: (2Fe-2S)-binding protein [Candidatus Bathyarchaeia archaeon]|nr:(2Fe-2S)-binding protein [Candidatus Bathyarchaeota archaeon]